MSDGVTWKQLSSWSLTEARIRGEGSLTVLPYFLPDGGLYAERVVAADGRRWWRPGDGRPVIPYGLERLEEIAFRRYRVLLIAEGESDALAAWGALAHHGVDVLGVPGAGTWRSEWAEHVAGYCAVYVCGDGDDAGRRMNDQVRRDTTALILPLRDGDDLRSLIQREGADAVLDRMAACDRDRHLLDAVSFSSTIDELEQCLGRVA